MAVHKLVLLYQSHQFVLSDCERSAGTVFQLPNPDAIYSRDEGKERRWLPSHVVCVRARSIVEARWVTAAKAR
jgi:hypothetical protein